MKNVFKVLGVIALAAVIVFSTTAASCGSKSKGGSAAGGSEGAVSESAGGGASGGSGGGGGGTFNSLAAFKTWLDKQPDNTAETAYSAKLNVSNLKPSSGPTINSILGEAFNKYVSLDCSGSTFTEISGSTFSFVSSLTGIILPARLTSIGVSAFSGCSNLTGITIPASVTEISTLAFSGCSNLTSVTIPAGVTKIGLAAFDGDRGALTSVTFQGTIGEKVELQSFGLTGLLINVYRAGGPGTYIRNGTTVRDFWWNKQ